MVTRLIVSPEALDYIHVYEVRHILVCMCKCGHSIPYHHVSCKTKKNRCTASGCACEKYAESNPAITKMTRMDQM